MATIAVPGGRAVPEERFRTCAETGLRVHAKAETLIRINMLTAVTFLAVGGLFGLMVALTRWQAIHLLPAEWFYLVLTAHGAAVLIFWIMFFEVALFYFTSAVVLNSRRATPWLAWVAYVLMLVGALVATVAVLQGRSSVMFTSYPPLEAEPHFYLGLILFAVGMLLTALHLSGLVTLTHTPSPMRFLGELLNRPKNERAYVLIPVGYPSEDAQVPVISKKPLSEILVRIE